MPSASAERTSRLQWNLSFMDEDMERRWWQKRLSSAHRKTEKVASALGIVFAMSLMLFMNAPLVSPFTSATMSFVGAQAFLFYACNQDEGRLYERVHDGTCVALRILRMLMNVFICAKINTSSDVVLTDWQMYLVMLLSLGSHLITIPLTFWLRFKHHIWLQLVTCLVQVAISNRYTCAVCLHNLHPRHKELLMHMCEFLFEASTGLQVPCEAEGFRKSCVMTGTFIPIVFGVIFTSAIVYVGEKASRTRFRTTKVS